MGDALSGGRRKDPVEDMSNQNAEATTLFSAYTLGRLSLKNRLVMAPMTRSRALGNVPNELMARYYAQRAEAGLIVSEATSPCPDGLGYPRIPGLWSAEQVAGWKKVTAAVHEAGSHIFVQLIHTGRVSHPDNLPSGARVLAPSALRWDGQMYVDGKGLLPAPTPEAMSEGDIEQTIEAFARSAELAIEAGFDGVELHGANGYLIEQFLDTTANQRKDAWGGSVENRLRFAVEVARRTAARIGSDRLGIRVSPGSNGNGMLPDGESEALHEALAAELSKLGLSYMHVVDHSSMGASPIPAGLKEKIRKAFGGTLILAGGYDLGRANEDLGAGRADLIAFGRPFVSNPRLASRLRAGLPLAKPDGATFYTPGEKGYTDYPLEP